MAAAAPDGGVTEARAAVAVVAVLAVHNLAGNLILPERWYVPANLATAAGVAAVAAAAGTGLEGLLAPPGVGLLVALGVAASVSVAAVVPATRRFLADRRMAGVDRRGTAWRTLVRIPLGTVVLEEVAFRAVLPDLLGALTDRSRAVAVASLLFGLWHVLPTARTLDTNGLAAPRRPRIVAVVAAVAATTVVGVALCRLRLATCSLLAPALVHAAANCSVTVAAYCVMSRPGGFPHGMTHGRTLDRRIARVDDGGGDHGPAR